MSIEHKAKLVIDRLLAQTPVSGPYLRESVRSSLIQLRSIIDRHKVNYNVRGQGRNLIPDWYIQQELDDMGLQGQCIWKYAIGYNDENDSGEFDYAVFFAVKNGNDVTLVTNLHCPAQWNPAPKAMPLEKGGVLNPDLVNALEEMRWPEPLESEDDDDGGEVGEVGGETVQ